MDWNWLTQIFKSFVDYILMDDLDLLHKNVELEEKLAMLIEVKEKQVIVTSTVAPKDIEVSSKLQDRLQWGITISIVSDNQWNLK